MGNYIYVCENGVGLFVYIWFGRGYLLFVWVWKYCSEVCGFEFGKIVCGFFKLVISCCFCIVQFIFLFGYVEIGFQYMFFVLEVIDKYCYLGFVCFVDIVVVILQKYIFGCLLCQC